MKNLTQIFTKNMPVKFLCLAAALILWIYVASSQSTTVKLPGSIKINPVNVPVGLSATFDNKFVELQISTDPATLHKLSPASFSAYIDLSAYQEGTSNVPIVVTTSIPNVKILSKKPDSVLVTLEPLVSKEVGIARKIEGFPKDGYVVSNINFDPEKITIIGAKSVLDSISEATALVRLAGEYEDFKKIVPVYIYDKDNEIIDGVKVQSSEVQAEIILVKGSNVKTVGIKPIISGNPKNNYYVSNIIVNPTSVDITGVVDLIGNIKNIETQVIDINGLSENLVKEVNLSLPEGVTVSAGSSLTATITIELSLGEVTKRITTGNIKFDLPPAFSLVSVSPSQINVDIMGDAEKISLLGVNSISISVDLRGRSLTESGDNYIDVKSENIILPAGFTLKDFTPKTLMLKVK